MATESRTPRLPETAVQAADALRWYYGTRPDAWRALVAPVLGAFLAFCLSIPWGVFGPLLALLVVGAFSFSAIRLIQEMRSLEAEARADVELEAKDLPWFGYRSAIEPGQLSAIASVSDAVELRTGSKLDLPSLYMGSPLDVKPPPSHPVAGDGEGVAAPATGQAPAPASEEPRYELCEGATSVHGALQTASSFLEAADLAFELIEQEDPAELEIVRVADEVREVVWSYKRSESAPDTERASR
jgi:hypothetical protein